MTINPRDYDLDELRKIARRDLEGTNGTLGEDDPAEIEWEGVDEEGVLSSESFRAGLYRELLPLESGADDDALEKPYLTGLPETYAAEFIVFEWLEFLLTHAGFKGAREALDYYESVGWVTEDVEGDLGDYLLGIDEPAAADPAELDVDDHMLSLVYVAKLVSIC